jgi:MFS family permease
MAKKRSKRRKTSTPRTGRERAPEKPSLLFQVSITTIILLVYGFFLAHQADLTKGDLGRHLKNGQLFVQNLWIPTHNLYSYTYPDYPFVNHHWGTGVIFYLIEQVTGFSGLTLAFIVLSLVTLLLFFDLAVRYASFALAAPIALLVIPVLITRHEVRPEVFSYLLSGVFLQVLLGYKYGKLSLRWLFLLPLLEIFWVNLHIYFFVGFILLGVFLLESFIVFLLKKDRDSSDHLKGLAIAFLLTLLAACLNPSGFTGASYPFLILKGYEVPVIENYSVRAVLSEGITFLPFVYFVIVFGLLCLSSLYAVIKAPRTLSPANLLLTVFFSMLAWWAIRNFAFFAYFALPLTAMNLKHLLSGEEKVSSSRGMFKLSAALVVIVVVLILIKPVYLLSSGRGPRGVGLEEANDAAADFFIKENLQGPIYNNYDVGAYLIYYLYPAHRVFIDNRPEAYPTSFFRDVYLPLHLDEEKWQSVRSLHGFNVLFFNHRDRSSWGEQFMIRRLLDPAWAPVYFDKHVLILLRRNGPNQSTVTKYELPKERILQQSN